MGKFDGVGLQGNMGARPLVFAKWMESVRADFYKLSVFRLREGKRNGAY